MMFTVFLKRFSIQDYPWILRRITIGGIVLWAILALGCFNGNDPDLLYCIPREDAFAILSDIEYNEVEDQTNVMLETFDYLRARRVNFLVLMGNSVAGRQVMGHTEEEDLAYIQGFKDILDTDLGVEYYPVAGNLDGPNFPTVFGDTPYSFDRFDIHFIVIGVDYDFSDELHWETGVGPFTQLDFLRNELSANENKLNFVFIRNAIRPCRIVASFPENWDCDPLIQILENDFSQTPIMVYQGKGDTFESTTYGNVMYLRSPRLLTAVHSFLFVESQDEELSFYQAIKDSEDDFDVLTPWFTFTVDSLLQQDEEEVEETVE